MRCRHVMSKSEKSKQEANTSKINGNINNMGILSTAPRSGY